jgi:ribosomal protein L37AE/L43A
MFSGSVWLKEGKRSEGLMQERICPVCNRHTAVSGVWRCPGCGATILPPFWIVTGEIIEIEQEKATLILNGVNNSEPFSLSIPQLMPGWALREGVCFEAEIPIDCLAGRLPAPDEIRNFRFLEYSNRSTEDLLNEIKLLTKEGNYGE